MLLVTVIVSVFHNATQIYTKTLAGSDRVGVDLSLTRSVAAGDAIYFRVNKSRNKTGDAVNWDTLITLN